jgi:L-seryl-tRNA(Ser) seleniumtransferase
MCLAALSAVLRLYADERRALDRVPVLRMLLEPEARVRARARRLVRAVRAAGTELSLAIEPGGTSPGGGALPDIFLPTALVAVSHPRIPEAGIEERLRRGTPRVVARVGRGKVLLDLRTVRDDEVPELAAAVSAIDRPPRDG